MLALPEAAASAVVLHYMTNDTPPVFIADLRDGPVTIALGAAPANVKWITLQVPTDAQSVVGETLLEISAATLGTRWLIPLSAEPGSHAGLWVGDVVVNDVSEARLGATDVAHDLTIAAGAEEHVRGARGGRNPRGAGRRDVDPPHDDHADAARRDSRISDAAGGDRAVRAWLRVHRRKSERPA